jgi:hypothetical protein
MKKIIVLMLLVGMISGCGQFDRLKVKVTGNATKTCVDGVTYLQFTSGATPQIDINGKPVACK